MKSGLLTHSLGTWPASIPVEVRYIETVITDSIPVPYAVKVYEYKEKPLTWWQKTRMLVGDACLFAAAGIILSFLVRYFLKKKL
jgi:type IV secretory pathway protease TraF